MAAARSALLKYLRVKVNPISQNPRPSTDLFALSFNAIRRHFSEDVRGSFLDKSEVTDRVISVVKNFGKVDPSKVMPL
ncbi:acyl carrier protein 2, mitochondrial-like [Carica papaya]|uniref:acyl carrier protein 2, mitochondrial-like n=1 Tax=Carica papaya TaxID=3649 RepID=UPI000B8C796A|nr:acyl carrier protein 2, mitochondrial-like [Carica papaya]